MDPSEFPAGEPPGRRELQGPRPAPLNVRKGSHKIKKPPVAPQAPPQQQRTPVIIYTVTPKVIHVHPSEFRSMVQRLTGAATGSGSSSSASTEIPRSSGAHDVQMAEQVMGSVEGSDTPSMSYRTGAASSGILSPVPSSLPAISPDLFSSFPDQNQTNMFHDREVTSSPAMQAISRSITDSNMLCSPGNLVTTPAAYWELFNQQYKDL